MHAQSGMDLKTLVEHFPGQSIQTNSVPEPSSPRRRSSISASSHVSDQARNFFLCENHIFWTYLMKFTNHIIVPLSVYRLCICSEVHFQIVFGDFSANVPERLWSEKMLTIYGFHIEKNSQLKWFSLGDPRPSWTYPGRGWLRDTSCLNRLARKVFHKGF